MERTRGHGPGTLSPLPDTHTHHVKALSRLISWDGLLGRRLGNTLVVTSARALEMVPMRELAALG